MWRMWMVVCSPCVEGNVGLVYGGLLSVCKCGGCVYSCSCLCSLVDESCMQCM